MKEKINFILSAQSIHWRCSKCKRTADSATKPGATYGGSCKASSNGLHTWIKDHF